MIIRKIHLKNVRSYIDATFVFPEGSTLLSGDIGSGKSSVLLAIEFALFGITRGVVNGSSILRAGSAEGSIELTFEIDGKECFIRRTLKRVKDDVRQDSGFIVIDGIKQEGTPQELKSRVLALLGYPRELLTKSKSLIYRYTVYCPQEEMKAILLEEGEARLDTLRKLFQIDRYNRIKENAQIVAKELRQMQAVLKGQTMDLSQKESLLLDAMTNLTKSKERHDELLPQAAKATIDKKAKSESLTAKEEELKLFRELKSEQAVVASQANERYIQIQRGALEIEMYKKAVAEIEARIASLPKALAKAIDEKLVEEELRSAEKERESFLRRRLEIEAMVKQAKNEIENQAKLINDISKLKDCPLCKQAVGPEHVANVRMEQQSKIDALQRSIMAAPESIAELSVEIERVAKKIQSLKESAKAVAEERLKEKEIANAIILLKDKKESLMQAEERQKTNKKEFSGFNSRKVELDSLLEPSKGAEDEAKSMKLELEDLDRIERKLLIELAKARTEMDAMDRNVKLLTQEVENKKKAQAELKVLLQKQNWLQIQFVNMMSSMEQQVMLKVYNEFNEIFQQFFTSLLDDVNISVNLNEEFTPLIEQNGYEIQYTDLSGGEKTSIALAYRLALNKTINDLVQNIKTSDLIILDEPTDGFSTDQLDRMRPVLEGLGTKQTIIVSHEQKIESFVDNVIRVTKREHASSPN